MSFDGNMQLPSNTLLASIENEVPVTGFRVDFSKGELSLQSSRPFNSNGAHGTLEEKDYPGVSMAFSLTCAFVDNGIGYKGERDLIELNFLYSEPLVETYGKPFKCSKAAYRLNEIVERFVERVEHKDFVCLREI